MTEKEFTDLANKHLTVLESYQLDENGNSQFNIFGLKQLYESINYKEFPSKQEMEIGLETLMEYKEDSFKSEYDKITFKFGFRTCFIWLEKKINNVS